jgi:hypothetical protein
MNKLKLSFDVADVNYLSKVIDLNEEDLINTDLPDLLKMVGFLYAVKISSQTNVAVDLIDNKIKTILESTKIKMDAEFGLDLSQLNLSNLHLTMSVKNKYSLSPTTNLQFLVNKHPALWDFIKLDLPNSLPENLKSIVDDGFVIVDAKIVSKLKETTLNLDHLEEVK